MRLIKINKFLISYLLAIVSPIIALSLTNSLFPYLQGAPSILFFVSISLTTWYGGIQPGLVSIVLSIVFMQPYLPTTGDLSFWGNLILLVGFTIVAIIIHRLQENLRYSQELLKNWQQAQTLLEEKESVLKLFSLYAPVGIAMFDEKMQYVAVSQRWVEEYNLGSSEMILGRSHYDIFPEIPERWKQVHQRCLNGAIEKCEEDLFIREDGSKQWLYWEVHPWYRFNKTIGGIIIFSVDISDLKLTHEALKDANKELETRVKQRTIELQNRTNRLDLLWNITQKIRQSLDLQEILVVASTEARHTLKADRVAIYKFNSDWSGDFVAESRGDSWVKLVNFNDPKVWKDTYLQENQGGRFQNQEVFVINDIYHSGLQPCHIELLEQFQAKAYATVPIFVGQVLWGLLAVYQNSTSRIWQTDEVDLLQQIAHQLAIAIQQSKLYNQLQLELQERQRAEAKVGEAERRWRSLLENVKLLVVGLDPEGTIDYVNPFFLQITGYNRSELLGKNWFQTFFPPPTHAIHQSTFENILFQNTDAYDQNLMLMKSGEERLIAWNHTPLKEASETVIGTISIGQDITDRQKLENIKSEFIGVVSHELRTPLTAIQMSLGLLNIGHLEK